jgi:hypothetical protein
LAVWMMSRGTMLSASFLLCLAMPTGISLNKAVRRPPASLYHPRRKVSIFSWHNENSRTEGSTSGSEELHRRSLTPGPSPSTLGEGRTSGEVGQ